MSWANFFQTTYEGESSDYVYCEFFDCCFPVAGGVFRNKTVTTSLETVKPVYYPAFDTLENPPETPRQRAIRRAKKRIKDYSFLNFDEHSRFLTLTYAGAGCHDRRQFQKDIKAMIRRLRTVEEVEIKYLGVFEEHKSGHGLHAHMLINCSFYKNEDFQQWFWQQGFVKLEKLKRCEKEDALVNVTQYLLKYLEKDFSEYVPREPLYFCSRNLRFFKKVECSEVDEEICDVILQTYEHNLFERVYDKTFKYERLDIKKRVVIFRKKRIYAREEFFEHSAQKVIDFLDDMLLQ